MEEKSLDTALEIYSVLAQGKSLKSDEAETAELYQAYYSDAEVYDITARLLAKLGLKAYEYKDAVFVTAGAGNKVFGLTNEDIKKRLTLKTNRELYLVYFIMYQALLMFYTDSASVQVREYVRLDEMMKAVTEGLVAVSKEVAPDVERMEETSFEAVHILWESLPQMLQEDRTRNRASRGSQMGYVKLVFNFLEEEGLFKLVADRYYPTDRLHAIAESYFEDGKSAIEKALNEITASVIDSKKGEEDA